MRISLNALDPNSPLSRRVRAAIARDDAERAEKRVLQAAEGDRDPGGCQSSQNRRPPVSAQARGSGDAVRGAQSGGCETWHREDDLHRAIVAMLAVHTLPGVIAFHPANGGKRGKAEAGRLKGMGVLAGIPDLIVIVAGRAHGLEIKIEAGRLSAAQKTMRARFARTGADYEVARSVAGARLILARWGAIASDLERIPA